MLTIRDTQLAILNQSVRERFGHKVIKEIEQSSPCSIQGLGKTEIRERLAAALRKADNYQLNDAQNLRTFVSLCFVVGPNFDEYPPFLSLFRSSEIPAHLLMDCLFSIASDQDWDRATVFDIVSRSRDRAPKDHWTDASCPQCGEESESTTSQPIALIKLKLKHAEQYFYQTLHPDIWRLGNLKPVLRLEEIHQMIRDSQDRPETRRLAVIDVKGNVVGAVSVFLRGPTAEISYWTGRAYWGQGIATRVVLYLVDLFSDNTKISRVTALIKRGNKPSRRVVEKCGFDEIKAHRQELYPDIRCFKYPL